MSLNIAIIGAGPAGCTLAHLLLNSGRDISVSIFEYEESFNARDQGGTLDLHTNTGILALRKAGLYDKFLEHVRFDGEAMILADKNMKNYLNMAGTDAASSRGRPEIDRRQLRQILIDGLPEDTIRWNHKLRKISSPTPTCDPKEIVLEFEHTSLSGFDLIVGADGAYSRVRPLLSDEKPYFSGVGCVRLAINDAANAAPEVSALVNRGSVFGVGDHKQLIAQQMGDGSIIVSAMLVRESSLWLKSAPWCDNDLEAVKTELLSEFADWDPQYKNMIEKSDVTPWISNLNMLPIGHKWTHRPGVTLIGDSAHLATPFAGEGVNLAMADSLSLSPAIISAASSTSPHNTLSSHVKTFEEDMFVRATKMQEMTYNMMRLMLFEANAPEATVAPWMCWAAGSEVPAILYPLVHVAVYGYFWYFRLWHRFWAKA